MPCWPASDSRSNLIQGFAPGMQAGEQPELHVEDVPVEDDLDRLVSTALPERAEQVAEVVRQLALLGLVVEGALAGEDDRPLLLWHVRRDREGHLGAAGAGGVRGGRGENAVRGVGSRRDGRVTGGLGALAASAARRDREGRDGEHQDEGESSHQYLRSSGWYLVIRTGLYDSWGAPSTQYVMECLRKFSSSRLG